jgi:hypothetical protein
VLCDNALLGPSSLVLDGFISIHPSILQAWLESLLCARHHSVPGVARRMPSLQGLLPLRTQLATDQVPGLTSQFLQNACKSHTILSKNQTNLQGSAGCLQRLHGACHSSILGEGGLLKHTDLPDSPHQNLWAST